MIVDPDRYVKTFADLGCDILTVHFEACTHLHRTLQNIKANGMKTGVALNPHTSVDHLKDTIKDIDLVCLMISVKLYFRLTQNRGFRSNQP